MIYAWQILMVVLLEGFVTLSVQILTLRQLIPFVGNSILVTSSVIGVMLLFLALGYRAGGLREGRYQRTLLINFAIAALLCGVGLSYPFLSFFFGSLSTWPSLAILYAYLLLITAPMVFLLGQTIPITSNLANAARIGEISGYTLFLSTLGSFAGSILTAALLMPFIGVAASVWFCVVVLLLLQLLLTREVKQDRLSFAATSVLILGVSFVTNIGFERHYFARTTAHANYQLITPAHYTDRETGRTYDGEVLQVNNSFSTFIGEGIDTAREVPWYINTVSPGRV